MDQPLFFIQVWHKGPDLNYDTVEAIITEDEKPTRRQLRKAHAWHGSIQFTDVDGQEWSVGSVVSVAISPYAGGEFQNPDHNFAGDES